MIMTTVWKDCACDLHANMRVRTLLSYTVMILIYLNSQSTATLVCRVKNEIARVNLGAEIASTPNYPQRVWHPTLHGPRRPISSSKLTSTIANMINAIFRAFPCTLTTLSLYHFIDLLCMFFSLSLFYPLSTLVETCVWGRGWGGGDLCTWHADLDVGWYQP